MIIYKGFVRPHLEYAIRGHLICPGILQRQISVRMHQQPWLLIATGMDISDRATRQKRRVQWKCYLLHFHLKILYGSVEVSHARFVFVMEKRTRGSTCHWCAIIHYGRPMKQGRPLYFALWFLFLLWSPCVMGRPQAYKFSPCFFLSSSFLFPRLILAVGDWMSTIHIHAWWPQCEFRMQV